MNTKNIIELSNDIKSHDALNPEERDILLKMYDDTQNEANLFPVNEVEKLRLFKMASTMFYKGRAYERLYSYENSLIK